MWFNATRFCTSKWTLQRGTKVGWSQTCCYVIEIGSHCEGWSSVIITKEHCPGTQSDSGYWRIVLTLVLIRTNRFKYWDGFIGEKRKLISKLFFQSSLQVSSACLFIILKTFPVTWELFLNKFCFHCYMSWFQFNLIIHCSHMTRKATSALIGYATHSVFNVCVLVSDAYTGMCGCLVHVETRH